MFGHDEKLDVAMIRLKRPFRFVLRAKLPCVSVCPPRLKTWEIIRLVFFLPEGNLVNKMKWADFDQSTTVRMHVLLFYGGNPITKSWET